jgi:hypothetical protein
VSTDKNEILFHLANVVARRGTDQPLALRLCWACLDILHVDGAAITIVTDGSTRTTLASTDATAERLDDLQDIVGEGPVPDAQTSGQIVAAEIGDVVQSRWPLFVPAAFKAVGDVRVIAVPIGPGSDVFGVLMLYQSKSRPLGHDPAIVRFLANAIGAALLREPAPNPEAADVSVSDTWSGRAAVHQATGMVIAQLGVKPDDALAILRAHAYAHEKSMRAIAQDVLERRLDFSRNHDSRTEGP